MAPYLLELLRLPLDGLSKLLILPEKQSKDGHEHYVVAAYTSNLTLCLCLPHSLSSLSLLCSLSPLSLARSCLCDRTHELSDPPIPFLIKKTPYMIKMIPYLIKVKACEPRGIYTHDVTT